MILKKRRESPSNRPSEIAEMRKLCGDLDPDVLSTFWVLLVFGFPVLISAIRTDISLGKDNFCRNTVQGRYLLSDENGYVCTALSVDSWTRCCPAKGDQFSCQGCNLVSQCCNSYEYCVSCCLDPSRTNKDLAMKMKIAKPSTAGTYASVFDFCIGRCRHNSASVVHENAYASEFHHCFSLQSKFSGGVEPITGARLTGIDIVIGRLGESCNMACSSRGQSCVADKLSLLNRCDLLQKYMNCKNGCFASMGSDQPAEVTEDAPKDTNPGACLYTQTESSLSCDGSHEHTKRLCPCA